MAGSVPVSCIKSSAVDTLGRRSQGSVSWWDFREDKPLAAWKAGTGECFKMTISKGFGKEPGCYFQNQVLWTPAGPISPMSIKRAK